MSVVSIFFCYVLSAVTGALAQDAGSPEAQATIQQGEAARLDRDSIGEYGPATRFEVSIVWDDAQGRRPAEHQSRTVRYVASCKEGTLTVAAIGVYDNNGMLVKRMMVPPGAAEPMTPDAGSPQARWLKDVCRARE
jgi:hypothetical protein